jgi:hypothetical protein
VVWGYLLKTDCSFPTIATTNSFRLLSLRVSLFFNKDERRPHGVSPGFRFYGLRFPTFVCVSVYVCVCVCVTSVATTLKLHRANQHGFIQVYNKFFGATTDDRRQMTDDRRQTTDDLGVIVRWVDKEEHNK